MKKCLLLVLLVFGLSFSLFGCKNDKTDDDKEINITGIWKVAFVNYEGEKMTVEEFARETCGSYADASLEYIEEYLVAEVDKNGKGYLGDLEFEWNLEDDEIEINWADEKIADYTGTIKATVKEKEIRVYIDSELANKLINYNTPVTLIFKKIKIETDNSMDNPFGDIVNSVGNNKFAGEWEPSAMVMTGERVEVADMGLDAENLEELILVVKKDGTAVVDGDEYTWEADGDKITFFFEGEEVSKGELDGKELKIFFGDSEDSYSVYKKK